jgi:hypothetical protein
MNKVTNDPACNLDPNASFEKPSNLIGDFNVNFVNQDSTSLINDIPDNQNVDDIKAESDYQIPEAEKSTTNAHNKSLQNNTKSNPIPKTEIKPNKDAQKPKAIFPGKKGGI